MPGSRSASSQARLSAHKEEPPQAVLKVDTAKENKSARGGTRVEGGGVRRAPEKPRKHLAAPFLQPVVDTLKRTLETELQRSQETSLLLIQCMSRGIRSERPGARCDIGFILLGIVVFELAIAAMPQCCRDGPGPASSCCRPRDCAPPTASCTRTWLKNHLSYFGISALRRHIPPESS
jgi:hypothetical protein